MTGNESPFKADSVAALRSSDIPLNSEYRRPVADLLTRIAWTMAASMRLPLILGFVVWELRALGESQLLAANLAAGLASVIWAWSISMVLYRSMSAGGLANEVLGWPAATCDLIRRGLWYLVVITCPTFAVAECFKHFESGHYSTSLGRIALLVGLSGLAFLMWRIAKAIIRYERNGPAVQKISFWHAGGQGMSWLAAILPMTLMAAGAGGYRFAAEQIGDRILWSVLGGLLVMMAWSVVDRLFRVYESRMHLKIAGNDSTSRQMRLDLKNNATQVGRLINLAGTMALVWICAYIWLSLLPAGSLLDGFVLWDGQAGADGVIVRITGRHLCWSILILMVAIGVSRNMGGLIELLLPPRLPLDKGGRFAISFVSRYVVVLIGLVAIANELGFSWDRVQWLAAGLTVGLGFGLQEVFANLVSGIIILLERPVRVGDYVSVNAVSGTVTRMALRATTIVDSDRREWIVPNKKFITDDVMNWTLTDTVSRAVFPISVAHGSDTRLVNRTLLEVARAQSAVLDYPEPTAVLVKIGPRSLDFELRCYLGSRASFSSFQNNLHMELNDALCRAGIEFHISETPLMTSLNSPPSGRQAA